MTGMGLTPEVAARDAQIFIETYLKESYGRLPQHLNNATRVFNINSVKACWSLRLSAIRRPNLVSSKMVEELLQFERSYEKLPNSLETNRCLTAKWERFLLKQHIKDVAPDINTKADTGTEMAYNGEYPPEGKCNRDPDDQSVHP